MMMVVKVGNLSEFMQEVQTYSAVRLSEHNVTEMRSPLAQVRLCLDLMGFNEGDELIWLHYNVEIHLTPGSNEPWTERDKNLVAAFPALVATVRDYLTEGSYIVRPGIYGIAQDIVPLVGKIEIVRWDSETGRFVRREEGA
jgi:hypothetical protein